MLARARGRLALVLVLCATLLGVQPGSTTTAAPLVIGCGEPVFKPNGSLWSCTFADEFEGTTLDPAKWVAIRTHAAGFRNGIECFVNLPQTVRVSSGSLRLSVVKHDELMACDDPLIGTYYTHYMAGMVSSWRRFSQTYGRFEFRARFPQADVAGLQSALWLWPVDANRYGERPASGEIDVAEFFSQHPDRVIPNVHFTGDESDPTRTNTNCLIKRPDRFHVYTLTWGPRRIKIQYDGTTCIVNRWVQYPGLQRTAPFDHPFHVNLTQALGIGSNAVRPRTPLPATMVVDYVRVWK
ncbi:MAG TPA: glycoside hydrolase family 16 protein [Nocardioidaceae bacterium]|nr:glycoside hydrolase family 16 protein [Nocardioidaceae bacterium]